MGDQFIQSCDMATKNRRFVNYLLDAIFVRMLAFPVWFLLGFFTSLLGIVDVTFWESLASPVGELIIGCASVFIYYFVCEALWQRTLAKLITGTKVVTVDGAKPTLNVVAIRTLVRFVPFEPFSFLLGGAGGWHDRWSGTMVVRTEAALECRPQPQSSPMDNMGFAAHHVGLHSWESMGQEASVPEPTRMAVAMSEPTSTAVAARQTSHAQGPGLLVNMKWLAVAAPVVVVLGAIMVWSANKPVESASASEAFEQTEPAYDPPSAPPVAVPPAASSVAVAPSASWDSTPRSAPSKSAPPSSAWVSFPPPPPSSASSPAGLPPTIQVDAVVTVDGKTVVFSDIGELTAGQTISGWKVVRITGREIVLKKGEVVHTYLSSSSGGN